MGAQDQPGRPLWSRDFLLLLLGRNVSGAGNHIHRVALASLVISVYGSTAYGTAITLTAIPPVVFAVLAGVICDRYARGRIMAAMDMLSSLIFGLLALLVAFDWLSLPALYAIVVVGASAGALFSPAASTHRANARPKAGSR